MRKYELMEVLYANQFSEYNDIYKKAKEFEVELLDKEIYIFSDNKRIIVMKSYESIKSAYKTYEDVQQKIKVIIDLLDKRFRKNVYYFICVNEILQDKHIKIINLIEKDQYICKKYVITSNSDFKRISFFKSNCNDNEGSNYNDIKVNDIFISLVGKYCKNENSIIYAKNYIDNNKTNLDNEG